MKNYQKRAITYYTCVLVLLFIFGLVYCIIVERQEMNTAYNENVTQATTETTTETTTQPQTTETTTKMEETTTTVKFSSEVKTTTAVPTPTETRSQPTTENSGNNKYLGSFSCTAYCSCVKCCGVANRPVDENGNKIVYGASGQVLTPGYSIATDPYVIPYGTIVVIDGKEYVAQDCGGAVRGNCIDFYFASHEQALNFGRQQKEVYLK